MLAQRSVVERQALRVSDFRRGKAMQMVRQTEGKAE